MKKHCQTKTIKKLRSFLAAILAAATVVAAIPSAAFAQVIGTGITETGDGATSPLWSGNIAASFAGGSGTPSDPYLIATGEQLAAVMHFDDIASVSDRTGMYFKLTADILLNYPDSLSNAWAPMGSEYIPFNGSFDGNGHKVIGLYIDTNTSERGLFGRIGTSGVVKNLGVTDGKVRTNKDYAGGICGYNLGKIIDCYNTSTVNVYNTGGYGGGIAGYNSGTISNCYNTGSISGTGSFSTDKTLKVGGICGLNQGIVTDCHNEGGIFGSDYASDIGGVCGECMPVLFSDPLTSGYTKNCYNTGNVTGNINVGGVVGDADAVIVTDCSNSGTITGSKKTGGICGNSIDDTSVSNCDNTGIVKGYSYSGGVCGYVDNSDITNCFNLGSVTSNNNTGGVCGYSDGSEICDCYNDGTIDGATYTGGICGYGISASILRCYNTASITGTTYVGGICSYLNKSSEISCCYNSGTLACYSNCIGGLVGSFNSSALNNSYNIGNIYNKGDKQDVGGLIGYGPTTDSQDTSISNCYAVCTISGSTVSLLGACNSSCISHSNIYFDITVSGGSADEFSKTTMQLTAATALSDLGFDSNYWTKKSNSGECLYYPDLTAFDDDEAYFKPGKPAITSLTPGNGQVTVTWDGVTGASRYGVYYYLNSGSELSGMTTDTSFTVTGLTNGTKYGFAVVACVNGIWTKAGIEDIVYETPLKVPSPRFAVKTGDGQVDVSWTTVAGASKYSVYTYLNGQYIPVTVTTGTSATISGLTNGTKYGVLVLACINDSWTDINAENLIYITPGEVPSPVITAVPGDCKVTVSWTEVTGASRYSLYYYLDDEFNYVGSTSGTSMVAVDLTNGVKYGFLVLACVDDNWTATDKSNLVYATPEGYPDLMFNVKAGNANAVVSWEEHPDATQYAVFYYLNGKYTSAGKTSGTSITVNGLTNGVEYGFIARALIDSEWTEFSFSDLVYATPFIAEKPIVMATPGVGQVSLFWGAISGATNYAVFVKDGTSWKSLGATGTNNSYTATGLTGGTTYTFGVKAYVYGTWSEMSDPVSATPTAAVTPAPTNVKAVPGDSKVTLTWDAVEGATNYAVFLRKGTAWLKIGSSGTNTTFTSRGLANGGKYFYMVKAYVNGVWSEESAIVSAIPVCITPQNVKASAGDSKVTLTWDAVPGASNYAVFLRKGTTWLKIGASGAGTTFTSRGLANGGKYFYMVKAYVNGSWSDESAIVSAIPVCITPQNVKAVGGTGEATITWDAVSGASNYVVLVKKGTSWVTLGAAGTKTTYTAKDLTGGETYYFVVKAYVNGAWSDMSETVSASVS